MRQVSIHSINNQPQPPLPTSSANTRAAAVAPTTPSRRPKPSVSNGAVTPARPVLPLQLDPRSPGTALSALRLSSTPSKSEPNTWDTRSEIKHLATTMHRSKKCVFVVGAGISVSAGIPDFRSENGLYNLVKEKYPNAVLKGKDLFDASLFRDPQTTALFYTFMAELKSKISDAQVTPTHHFIKHVDVQGKLLRCYTQNIDCLENRLTLSIETTTATTSSASGLSQSKRYSTPIPRLMHLHGDLDKVVCTLCKQLSTFTEEHRLHFSTGASMPCPQCQDNLAIRLAQGKRAVAVGILRPNVVLYNEHHSGGADIASIASQDCAKKPDVLLVLGTSLKVDGVRRLVRDLARSVKANKNGLVVFINRTPPSREWESVFDLFVEGDSDDVVQHLQEEMCKLEAASEKRREARELAKAKKAEREYLESAGVDSMATAFTIPEPSSFGDTGLKMEPDIKIEDIMDLIEGSNVDDLADQENEPALLAAPPTPILRRHSLMVPSTEFLRPIQYVVNVAASPSPSAKPTASRKSSKSVVTTPRPTRKQLVQPQISRVQSNPIESPSATLMSPMNRLTVSTPPTVSKRRSQKSASLEPPALESMKPVPLPISTLAHSPEKRGDLALSDLENQDAPLDEGSPTKKQKLVVSLESLDLSKLPLPLTLTPSNNPVLVPSTPTTVRSRRGSVMENIPQALVPGVTDRAGVRTRSRSVQMSESMKASNTNANPATKTPKKGRAKKAVAAATTNSRGRKSATKEAKK